jgi:hypothetical protein
MFLEREELGVVSHSLDQDRILKDFEVFKLHNWPHNEIKLNAHNLYSSEYAFSTVMGYIINE